MFHYFAASFQEVGSGVGLFYRISDLVTEGLFRHFAADPCFTTPIPKRAYAYGGHLVDGRLMSDLTVVKGSESLFAIKRYPTIQLGNPGYYRKDEKSLVWDLKGVCPG